jgi:hypothetical protein
MRLDFEKAGGVRLAVLGVAARQATRELYAEWIAPRGP